MKTKLIIATAITLMLTSCGNVTIESESESETEQTDNSTAESITVCHFFCSRPTFC